MAYLLDTNAYFKILCYIYGSVNVLCNEQENLIKDILSNDCYISEITKIEIISVVGKYARGKNKQIQKCECIISEDGQKCTNNKYIKSIKKWKNKEVQAWLKLIKDIENGDCDKFKVKVLSFNDEVLKEAQKFIRNSIKFNFRSLDSIVAGTLIEYKTEFENLTLITSDKGLIAGMRQASLPCKDILCNVIAN